MSEISIPDEALKRAFVAAKADNLIALGASRGAGVFNLLPDIIEVGVKTAAPLVVAAELDRLTGEIDGARSGKDDEWDSGWHAALDFAMRTLKSRASELRGRRET